MPLDKSFIQTTLSNTANNQSYFADSHLKLQSRHYSIDTPNQSDEFWVPANIAKSAQLEKQRSSLPTNVPISFENSERKLKCQIIMASKINESMFKLIFIVTSSDQCMFLKKIILHIPLR